MVSYKRKRVTPQIKTGFCKKIRQNLTSEIGDGVEGKYNNAWHGGSWSKITTLHKSPCRIVGGETELQ